MKKLFKIIIIINFILPNGVYAATYYGKETINYQTTKPINTNYEEEYRYKFYEEQKIYSNAYYVEDLNDPSYPYKSNDFIETDYTDWSKERPKEEKGRIIKTKEMYEYAKALPIRYLYFYDIMGSNDALRFLEVKVYSEGKDIAYTLECTNCKNKEKIMDNQFDQGYTSVLNQDTFILDLKGNYDLEKLKLEVYLTDNYGTDKSTLKISALDDQKQVLKNYTDVYLESNMYNTEDSGYRFNIDLKDYLKDLYYEKQKITTEEKIEEEEYKLISQYTLYAYKDIKYKYYRMDRNYLEGYYIDKPGYIKDQKQYKIYYKIKNRETITFKENYVITSRDYNLYDLIEKSSIDKKKIQIKDTININKNGLYKITFSYQDFQIDQYVTLDVEEKMESIHISKESNVEQVDKITIKTGQTVKEQQKEEDKNEKQPEKNSIFSYLSISMFLIVKRILGI